MDGLEQKVQNGLQPLQLCWLFRNPLLGLAEQLGTPCQGWAHTVVPRTHVTYFCHCAQTDLSTGPFLLVPLEGCYRNQNPQ